MVGDGRDRKENSPRGRSELSQGVSRTQHFTALLPTPTLTPLLLLFLSAAEPRRVDKEDPFGSHSLSTL